MSCLRQKSVVFLALLSSLVLPHLACADDGMAGDGDSNANRDRGMNLSARQLNQYALVSPDRDDYHSNINLEEMLQDSPTYSLAADYLGQKDGHQQQPVWFANLQRGRFSRSPFMAGTAAEESVLASSGNLSPAMAKLRPQLVNAARGYQAASRGGGPVSASNQDLATRARLWATDIIGELLQAQQKQRAQQKRFLIPPNQLSQQTLSSALEHQEGGATQYNEISPHENLMATNREKRRRCKSDPNLSVKNPSFCDTDAYFGAADYSMRDVWDTAGR